MSVVVVFGPSGVGKSTVINRLLQEYPNQISFSVSHTSRSRREGEMDGNDYYYVSKTEFLKMVREGKFLEWTNFAGKYYGTSYDSIQSIVNQGKICILDLDLFGVKALQTNPGKLKIKYIKMVPPSLKTLRNRITKRGDTHNIDERIRLAEKDLREAEKIPFDYTIMSDDRETTYQNFADILAL